MKKIKVHLQRSLKFLVLKVWMNLITVTIFFSWWIKIRRTIALLAFWLLCTWFWILHSLGPIYILTVATWLLFSGGVGDIESLSSHDFTSFGLALDRSFFSIYCLYFFRPYFLIFQHSSGSVHTGFW